jgi:hypothetical protein
LRNAIPCRRRDYSRCGVTQFLSQNSPQSCAPETPKSLLPILGLTAINAGISRR